MISILHQDCVSRSFLLVNCFHSAKSTAKVGIYCETKTFFAIKIASFLQYRNIVILKMQYDCFVVIIFTIETAVLYLCFSYL